MIDGYAGTKKPASGRMAGLENLFGSFDYLSQQGRATLRREMVK
jgi:hypothetical protein